MLQQWRGAAILSALMAGLCITARPALGLDEDEIPLATVPSAVRLAAAKAVPDAKWAKAFKSTEDDETIYELTGSDSKGREIEVELTPAGKVLEIETGLPIADVPQLVRDVLGARAKGIKIDRARAVTQDGKVVAYSFDGRNAKDQSVEVRVSTDGKAVEIEVDDD
ncbi:MAG: hypothetical protein P4L84_03240 [Isosphaeraceae bacterium]|nr:hypothetical protein [Isosphaeraceae bacterium]